MKRLIISRFIFYLVICMIYTGVLIIIAIVRGRDVDLAGKMIESLILQEK